MKRARMSRALLLAFVSCLTAVGIREAIEARDDADFGGDRSQERLLPGLGEQRALRLEREPRVQLPPARRLRVGRGRGRGR